MRSRMRRSLLRTAVFGVLVCTAVRGWAAQPVPEHVDVEEHRCGFDELQARTINTRVSGVSRVGNTDAGERSAVTASTAWQPIRIAVFTDDIADSSNYCTVAGQTRSNYQGGTVTCQSAHVLTSGKKQTLLEFLIPSAVQLHQERLNVQRESGNIIVDSSIQQDSICGQFSIPASHMTTGVADADFVLYMAAGPTSGNVIAWATTCQNFADGRPSVGVSNVSPMYISAQPQTVRVITHEILHALGFNIYNFQAHSMKSSVRLRGKASSPVMNTTNVVAQAQKQYGCPSQTFMELEDAGGDGTAYSHWKRRSAKDELMAGISGAGYYTALTIAAMEDMGYYKGNYAMAEPMVYGQNAGCSLTTSKCVVNGASQIPEMFCASTKTDMVCASDHLGVGYCTLGTYTSALPSYFQYFANPTTGGIDALMDYCPYVQTYRNTNCTVNSGFLLGSVFGVMSRCLSAPSGVSVGGQSYAQYALCAEVQCGATTYGVKVNGASGFTTCTPGTAIPLRTLSSSFSGGSITCPAYDSVCGMRVNATLYEQYSNIVLENHVSGGGMRTTVVLAVAAAVAVVAAGVALVLA